MKFCFVLTNLSGGGAEKAVLKIAHGLLGRGHAVDLVLLEGGGDYDLPDGLGRHLLVPGGVASKGWLGKRLLAWRLARTVRRLGPDVVISSLPFADEVTVLANLPNHWCRIANTLSAEIARLAARSPGKAARRLARYRAMYGQRALIAVSSGVAADLRDALGIASPIETIPNPFAIESIRQAAAQPAGVPSLPYVVHVGRFSAQKRHDLLLDAWQRLDTGHQLVLLAQPDERLRRMIAERGLDGRVVIAGFQQNPYPWLAAAELLVLCSDHEGLPNVLIEALICGTPVVSTDCPSGPREILGEALPEALVPCGDAAALAGRIAAFLTAPPDISRIDLERFGVERALTAYERLASLSGGGG